MVGYRVIHVLILVDFSLPVFMGTQLYLLRYTSMEYNLTWA